MSVLVHSGQFDSYQPDSKTGGSAGVSRLPYTFLTICFATIAAISMLDTWFAVQNSCIMIVERNPICLALMKLDPESLSFFVVGKLSGTLVVLLTLLALHRVSFKHANTITLCVAFFQVGLLTHLTLSDPLTYGLPNFSLLFEEFGGSIWQIK